MDYFLCRPIYTYPYTINLTYYDTIVLIMKNTFLIRYLSLCILLHVKLIWCSGLPEIYGGLGGMSAMDICAFFSVWNLFGVVVFQRCMVNWGVYICHGYMCILLYVKLIWCGGVPEICGWLPGGQWHSNNNKNNNKWINVHKLWNLFGNISIVVTLSCCSCSCSACLAQGMS